MNRPTIQPRADREIDNIAAYISLDNWTAANRFIAAVADALVDIRDYPTWNPFYDEKRFPGLRRKPIKGFENYVIFLRH